MIGKFFSAASQVLFVSLIVGAGLPAIFAVGVRSLAVGAAGPGSDTDGSTVRRNRFATVFGVCCFALVVAAVAIGITIIVAAGFGKTVSFDHVIPTLVNKK